MISALLLLAAASGNADAWARCATEKVSLTTSNWLRTEPTSYVGTNKWDDKAQNLSIRVIAACYRSVTSGPIDPKQIDLLAIRSALVAGNPVPSKDATDPGAFACQVGLGNRGVGIDWIVRDGDREEKIISTRFLRDANDDPVALEAQIKSEGKRRCFHIESDGSLTDA